MTVCTACPVGVATCSYDGTAFTALTCEPTYYFTATAGTVLASCTPSFTESCELCIEGCFACEDDTVCDECGEGYEDDGEGACEEEEDDGGDGGDDSSSSSLLKPIIYISMILALILFY